MTQLTVVAKIQAKPGSEAVLYRELLQLIQPTLLENGCINYDLHCSIEDKALFLFYENWTSHALWQQHMTSNHVRAFENWELLLMEPEKTRS